MPDWIVEEAEGRHGPARYSADTPRDAAEDALADWAHDREMTYDGEEADVMVKSEADGSYTYFRGAAQVVITWTAAQIDGPEAEPDDEGPPDADR